MATARSSPSPARCSAPSTARAALPARGAGRSKAPRPTPCWPRGSPPAGAAGPAQRAAPTSGSCSTAPGRWQSIARDVVDGFDRFFAEQREVAGDATVTVVQFDDQDPHDVVVDARPIADVRSIAGRFEPRGCTPLYDAVGLLLDRVEAPRRRRRRPARRRHDRRHGERQPALGPAVTVPRGSATSATGAGRSCSSAPTRTATRPAAAWASAPATSATSRRRADGRGGDLHRAQPNRARVAGQGPGAAAPRPRRLLGRPEGSRGAVTGDDGCAGPVSR